MRDDEAALTAAIIAFATEYGRYGYRRIAAMLRDAGVGGEHQARRTDWRREGLKVPQKQPKRGRLFARELIDDDLSIKLRLLLPLPCVGVRSSTKFVGPDMIGDIARLNGPGEFASLCHGPPLSEPNVPRDPRAGMEQV